MPKRHIAHRATSRCALRTDCASLRRDLSLRWLVQAVILLLFWLTAARADLFEAFESPQPSWQVAEADCAVQVAEHRRTFQERHQGQGSEYLRLRAGAGTHVYLTHAMPAARIISELSPSLWVKSDRPGLQLLVRVVLPHSPVGSKGELLKTLLRGEVYTDVGNWQRLAIPDLPRLMTRELALLRSQFGPQVDPREAYVDLVVLNAYGGAGDTQVWLDNLSVTGVAAVDLNALAVQRMAQAIDDPQHAAAPAEASSGGSQFTAARIGGEPAPIAPPAARMEIQGDILSVDGRPRFVRAVQYSGERFEFLRDLGFNAVRLSQPATPAQLREARESGVWLIAPPPGRFSDAADLLAHNSVLVWDAGTRLTARELETTRQVISQARASDPLRRPLLTMPSSSLAHYSRMCDIVALRSNDLPPVGGAMPLGDYRPWLQERRRLLRPGMACWAVLPTQLPVAVKQQWQAFDPEGTWSDQVEPQQLHELAYQALAAGARGLLFESRERLDQSDPATALRATTLQCLNQQLALFEPWVAGGTLSNEYEVSDPTVSVALLKTERSVLALLTQAVPNSQYVSHPLPPKPVSLVVRGVPASAYAFSVSPLGLTNLRAARHGGMHLQLPAFRHSAAIAIAQDPLAISHLSQQAREIRPTATRSRRELVSRQLAMTQETIQQSWANATERSLAASNFEQAEALLRRSELLADSGDPTSSVGAASESLEFLAAVRRDAWSQSVRGFPSPTSSPACVCFAALPLHWNLAKRLSGSRWGANRLPAGAMEDLGFMQAAGWDQERTTERGIATHVELTPEAPHGGSYSLRLVAQPSDPASSPLLMEQPAVVVHSAPVQLRTGQIVQIRGWVKVTPTALSEPTTASKLPLLVYDSLGGTTLAQPLTPDGTWREFVLYRAADSETPVTVSFALRSYGEALIDDVTITPLDSVPVATSTE